MSSEAFAVTELSPVGRLPTMGDVAAMVGMSRQSVSLVFRNAPGPSPETREKVLKAADVLGYRPDMAARMLRRRDSQHIGVLITVSHAFEQDLIDSMYAVADEMGYVLMLAAITPVRDEAQAVGEMLGYRPGALILVGANVTQDSMHQLTRQIPVVQVGAGDAGAGADSVSTDGAAGIAEAVQHLLALGHRSIAYVDGGTMPGAADRKAGYLDTMAAAGAIPGPILRGDYSEESGADAARRLLAENRLPTAVVASNDQMAAGLMTTLMRAGVSIPEDISVTGYDDSRVAQLSYIDLTTVRQDSTELAKVSLTTAIARMADTHRQAQNYVLTPRLVVRSSTGAPSPR
jgi:DNA-binding LacI/PurR family transcriptional regulator